MMMSSQTMRMHVFRYVLFLAFAGIIGILMLRQVYQGSYYFEKSENNRLRVIPVAASRGRFLDRHYETLVDNQAFFDVAVIPEDLRSHEDSIVLLSELLVHDGVTVEKIHAVLKEGRRSPFVPLSLVKNISFRDLARLEERLIDLPGVVITPYAVRDYRQGALASHVLGYIGEISASEYERLQDDGYHKRDYIGKTGLEKAFDSVLKGQRGWTHMEITASGRHVQTIKEIAPIPGSDIILTLDREIQHIVEEAFGSYEGACLVMASQTGDILAMVSRPIFDSNHFVGQRHNQEIQNYFSNEKNPMMNRCLQVAYSPGSIFKIVVALAGLEENIIRSETTFFCDGSYQVGRRPFRCMGAHGDVDLAKAIERSCNVYFYQLGLKLGPDRIAKYARRLGLGHITGIALPYEKKGIVPSKDWKKRNVRKDSRWYDGETAVYAIGQGFLQVTPLQLLFAMNAVVNNGRLFRPQLVKEILESPLNPPQTMAPVVEPLGFNSEHLAVIREGMHRVVHSPHGTGRQAKIPGHDIGGKTSTVQVRDGNKKLKDHGWFFAFSPVKAPKYSIIVIVEHQGSGGGIPAGIAKDVLQKIWEKEEYAHYLIQEN